MSTPLRPDRSERVALGVAALEALERLTEVRDASPLMVPFDQAMLPSLRSAPADHATDADELLDRFVAAAATGTDKPSGGNMSFIPNGMLPAGIVAGLLAAGSHGYTGGSHDNPALVAMEEGILDWMVSVVGLPEGAGGVLLSGGSLANLAAVVAARDATIGEEIGRGTMYVSARVHHSVTRAAHLAGIPSEAIRTVATDAEGRLEPETLETAIAADRAAGRHPFLVVGIAGSTDTGSIDPLAELAQVARSANAWFHVDAAYGGFFALTERGAARLTGMGGADSLILDAHKSLFIPYGVAAVLARDPDDLMRPYLGHGQYLRDAVARSGLPHYFERGPELTRPFRGMLVWFPLHLHGVDAFRSTLDRMLDLAELAYAELQTIDGIEVGAPPALSVVAFRATEGDEATDAIARAIDATGRLHVTTTVIDGRVTMRLAMLNPRTTTDHVEEAVEIIRETVAVTA